MTVDSSAGKLFQSRAILVLLFLSLALRLGWGLTRPATDASLEALPDQVEYLSLGRNLLHGNGLVFFDRRFNDAVRAFRTPGYPILVAACGGNVRTIRAVQALLDTSTVLAVFLLAGYLVSAGTGPLLAALFVAFNPYLVYFSSLILSETLFTAMLAWAMVLLVRGVRQAGIARFDGSWLVGALLLALSVLVRPSAIALPVLLGLLSLFLNRPLPASYQMVRWRLPPGFVLIGITFLCLFPWALRNRMVLGRWIWLDTNSGFTLYDGYNPDAMGESNQTFVDRQPELVVLNETGRDEYLSEEASEYARTHPSRVLALAGAKLARTWSPMPLSQEYGRPALRAIALAYSLPFDVLVLIGVIWGRLPRAAKFFLLAPAVYFTIIHAFTVGSLRYRVPAEPPLAVLITGLAATGATPWRRTRTD